MQLLVKNGLILQTNGTFLKGHINIDEGKIASVLYGEKPPSLVDDISQIDAEGLLVSPGLIDTHIHGGNRFSFNFPNEGSSWEKMEERLSSLGVTSVLATGTSLCRDDTLKFIERAAALAEKNNSNKVEILGIYMEGPYLSNGKRGAHREESIRPASMDEIKQILDRAGGLVKVWALAPEIEENLNAIKNLAGKGISVSLAHTEADYKTALAAFSAGAGRVTHTFNGMPALDHRYEGIVTAAWQYGAFMEIIADGHHLSPTVVRMLIMSSDPGKIVLVSDNNELAGLPDGIYAQGNRTLTVKNGQMRTESGNLAGSVENLNRCALNLTRWGFSAGAALRTVTENPARSAGVFEKKGSIAAGKDADIVIFNDQFEALLTVKAGRIVYRSDRFPVSVSGG